MCQQPTLGGALATEMFLDAARTWTAEVVCRRREVACVPSQTGSDLDWFGTSGSLGLGWELADTLLENNSFGFFYVSLFKLGKLYDKNVEIKIGSYLKPLIQVLICVQFAAVVSGRSRCRCWHLRSMKPLLLHANSLATLAET